MPEMCYFYVEHLLLKTYLNMKNIKWKVYDLKQIIFLWTSMWMILTLQKKSGVKYTQQDQIFPVKILPF